MSALFTPLAIKSITLKNRIVVSPMCQYSAKDGFANDWHLVHLGSRAVGGAGLIIMEANAVSPEGRITPGDLGIWSDDHIPGLKRIVDFVHQQGSICGIQLAHAGRKASHTAPWLGGTQIPLEAGGWLTVAPSAIAFKEDELAPAFMHESDIRKLLEDFTAAAKRALQAGFRVLEIHAAHGYLLNEFLSPLSNHRKDQYGGSFENRSRLLLEVIDAIKTVWPAELPLLVRISATEWTTDGWSVDDSVKLAGRLKDKGIDLVDCSSGGNIFHAQIPLAPGYQVHLASAVRKTGIMTGAVGLITDAQQAVAVLEEGHADLVFLARELLRNPYFPLMAAHELGVDVKWPNQYLRAKPR